jgi:hypothetical protein
MTRLGVACAVAEAVADTLAPQESLQNDSHSFFLQN